MAKSQNDTLPLTIIHPKCLIEEKVKICRHWVCFIPDTLPTITLNNPIKIFVVVWKNGIMIIINRGPSFCHTKRIRISVVWRVAINLGSQKWRGAIPSFNIRAIKKNLITLEENL